MKRSKITLPMMKARNNVSTYGIEREDESLVAIVFNQQNMRVIANLFAAAPEMYETLEEILVNLDTFPQVVPGVDHPEVFDLKLKLRKLLRKARGESEVEKMRQIHHRGEEEAV